MRFLLLCLTFGVCAAADRAEYIGGTVGSMQQGHGVFELTNPDTLAFRAASAELKILWDRINLLEYGQQVDRRIGMAIVVSPLLVLSKKRKHFLTIGFTDDAGRQQAAVFRLDKGSVRTVLSSLEARTGRKVQYQDVEARKAGKG